MGEVREFATEGGVGSGSLGKVLPHGSSGNSLVWSGDVVAFSTNYSEVRVNSCGFPASGHREKGNTAEGWVLAAGDGKSIPTGIGDTAAPDIYGQETGDSGGVGGPTNYF